ncbi:MAG: GNAT family N-acetyltransferase [Balneolaceae bacterium]
MLPDNYKITTDVPKIDTYRMLREQSGLSPKSEEAARLGLKGTLFSVQIFYEDDPVGMGRLIGDGGCHFQIVDMAVLPAHQGKGLGKEIMKELSDYIDQHLPDTAYISLIADGPADKLYAKFGFEYTAPASVGMYRRVIKK